MTDSSGHPDLDQAGPNLSDDHKLTALRSFQGELEKWNTDNSPSESGVIVEDVPSGHPLHAAVVALEHFYGGRLPRPALRYWRRFLKLARNDDEAAEDDAEELRAWVTDEIELITDVSQPAPSHSSTEPTKRKRKTGRGEARPKLKSALIKHHNYAEGGCLNFEPIGPTDLGKLAGVAKATASDFFTDQFADKNDLKTGYEHYKILCNNKQALITTLKVWNGDFSPSCFRPLDSRVTGERDEEK
jgi:hypothetical protein